MVFVNAIPGIWFRSEIGFRKLLTLVIDNFFVELSFFELK